MTPKLSKGLKMHFLREVVIQVNGGGINRSLLPDKATQANLAAIAMTKKG